MKIYTKSGDRLKTSTYNDERVFKNDMIIEINGTIDELQSHMMVAYNFTEDKDIQETILFIVKQLFSYNYGISSNQETITKDDVNNLEKLIDKYQGNILNLGAFVYPGMTKAASFIHVSRTICRRAERSIISFYQDNTVDETKLEYINRLSDLLYIMALNVDKIKYKNEELN